LKLFISERIYCTSAKGYLCWVRNIILPLFRGRTRRCIFRLIFRLFIASCSLRLCASSLPTSLFLSSAALMRTWSGWCSKNDIISKFGFIRRLSRVSFIKCLSGFAAIRCLSKITVIRRLSGSIFNRSGRYTSIDRIS
uniref:Secreted protein n=1 Tax=Haemonchus placei TaxID=6290 RepID=A0A158QLU0_HAEPC